MSSRPSWRARRRRRAHGRVALDDLRVERKAEPIGIDVERPRFSWVVGVARARHRAALVPAAGDQHGGKVVWDSGVVRSRESSDVAYGGPALARGDALRLAASTS